MRYVLFADGRILRANDSCCFSYVRDDIDYGKGVVGKFVRRNNIMREMHESGNSMAVLTKVS